MRVSLVYEEDFRLSVMYKQESCSKKVQLKMNKVQEESLILLTIQEQPQTQFTFNK